MSNRSNRANRLPFRIAAVCFLLAAAVLLFHSQPALAAEGSLERMNALGILVSSGVNGGVIVHLGCGDGKLTAALRVDDAYLVHGLDTEAANVAAARKHIQSAGLYGPVSVDRFDGKHLPYTDNLVNLIVADDLGDVSLDEVMRVLVPGGVAHVKQGGAWTNTVKPWPKEIDEWTHFLHGPDGNPVANDTVVGPPRHYQWISEPMWLRSHDTDSSISAVVTSGGRIFYIVDEAPISLPGNHPLPDKWFLAARDAFNGMPLWKVPIQHWGWREWKDTWFLCRPGDIPLNLEMRLIASGEHVYVTLGYRAPVSQLDARTGEILKTYDGTKGTREMLLCNGTLILTIPPEPKPLPDKVVALNPETGERLWETEKTYRGTTTDYIRWKEVNGQVKPAVLDPALNPATDGRVISLIDGHEVVGLDFKTGRERWRTTIPNEQTDLWMGAMIVSDGTVVYASQTQLVGLSADSGEILWTQPKKALGHLWYEWKDVFVIDGLVWTYSAELAQGQFGRNRSRWPVSVNGYDLHTGELKREVPLGGIFKTYHHHRCYRAKATVRYILASRRGTEYIDLEKGHHTVDNWVRGTCHFGMMPANGLQYAPPHPCRCYILEKLNGFNALAPAREERGEKSEEGRERREEGAERLQRGPAYGLPISNLQSPISSSPAWPTYRHDAMRSGGTVAEVPARLDSLWNVNVGRRVSPPIAVGDRVFVALVDEHQVVALDAGDGSEVWRFCTGGRVDSPPTWWRGTLLFGSADGCVYCVRASDGELAWRFRAAPEDRRIGAFDQLESAWPVHGSVLVLDGKAYFAAGRSSHLDGGIFLYALDAGSGKVVHETNLEGPTYTVDNIETNFGLPEGTLPDILLGDDRFVYMRGYRFDRTLGNQQRDVRGFGALGGFLDDTYFQRAYWYSGGPGNFARLTARDADSLYLVRMFDQIRALDPDHYFTPGAKGYALLAQPRDGGRPRWSTRIPVRVQAMVVAGGRLFTAGPPDVVDPNDPLGAFEGRKGGILNTFDTATGQKLFEANLEQPPVFNGMAAAAARLYVSTATGRVLCLTGKADGSPPLRH